LNQRIASIIERIEQLESELEAEFARGRTELAFTLTGGVVRFEEHILKRHRQLKTRLSHYILRARPLMLVSAPIIYAVLIPFVLLDLFVSLYQFTCFPVFGIPAVRRGDYIVFDRGHLAYLNLIEKINCAYCSYANGLIAYVREIASLTEQFWCPIKHARRVMATHARYARFVDYGDAEHYPAELEALRQQLRQKNDQP
jgi:hypothetical protein